MKRTLLLKLGLLLLLGAIINVAVAWGCTLWSSVKSCTPIDPTKALVEQEFRYDTGGFFVERSVAFGRVDILVDSPGIDDQPKMRGGDCFALRRAGWPLLCLSGASVGEITLHRALPVPAWLHPRESEVLNDPELCLIATRSFLPIVPELFGFAVNTVFYAALVWLLFFAPFQLRRWRRIKRGLCPACAYPVGTSDKCTECGTPKAA